MEDNLIFLTYGDKILNVMELSKFEMNKENITSYCEENNIQLVIVQKDLEFDNLQDIITYKEETSEIYTKIVKLTKYLVFQQGISISNNNLLSLYNIINLNYTRYIRTLHDLSYFLYLRYLHGKLKINSSCKPLNIVDIEIFKQELLNNIDSVIELINKKSENEGWNSYGGKHSLL